MKSQHHRSAKINCADIITFLTRLARNQVQREQALDFLHHMGNKKFDAETATLFVRHIQQQYPPRKTCQSSIAVNIVGTGGGRATFNISTTAAIVAAAAGATVIKSGSNSYTSQCGSLDVLMALGINLNISFDKFSRMIADIGLGFINPVWYPPILRRLAVTILPDTFKTVGSFINILGPLLSPVQTGSHLIGVKSRDLIDSMAVSFHRLNLGHAIVCWSEAGMDEFCSLGTNYYRRVDPEGVGPLQIDRANPVNEAQLAELNGGCPRENAAITLSILNSRTQDVKMETVIRNAAYILLLSNLVETISQGIELAEKTIHNGHAMKKFQQALHYSNQ